jgi:hypothetical protein
VCNDVFTDPDPEFEVDFSMSEKILNIERRATIISLPA